MIQRLALLAGGIGAAAVLAIALGAGNLFGAAGQVQTAAADTAATTVAAADTTTVVANDPTVQPAQTKTKTVVDKVYIAPSHPPKVIRNTATTPTTKPSTTPATPPAPPKPPAAAPRSHDDGGYDDEHESQQSERDGGNHRDHERGDD